MWFLSFSFFFILLLFSSPNLSGDKNRSGFTLQNDRFPGKEGETKSREKRDGRNERLEVSGHRGTCALNGFGAEGC